MMTILLVGSVFFLVMIFLLALLTMRRHWDTLGSEDNPPPTRPRQPDRY